MTLLDGWTITLGDGEDAQFEAVKKAPRWLYVKIAKAAGNGNEDQLAALTYDLFTAVVVKADRQRLDHYLMDNEDAFELMEQVCKELNARWTGLPLAEPSSSAPISPTPQQPQSYRVVSLSQGTHEEVTADQMKNLIDNQNPDDGEAQPTLV